MVEILAHELNRATTHILTTLSDRNTKLRSLDQKILLNTLESQLKTLQKRLRILDPLSTSGRQVKENFDLVAWVQEILVTHNAQFKRHKIRFELQVEPDQSHRKLMIHAVKGMIVQILENLISNSVYWLKQEKLVKKDFDPEIRIKINTKTKDLFFTDNGPGIDCSMREDVFQAFVTTKPPGEGKGLGLFISREIATYNGVSLNLLNQPTIHPNTLNTFVLALGGDHHESGLGSS
jgi:signal transduction histidine kinase